MTRHVPVMLAVLVSLGAALTSQTLDVPVWRTKSPAQWDAGDAKQILSDSPWVKTAKPQRVPDLSADQRRESGDMQADMGGGVGLAGTGILGRERQAAALARAHQHPDPGTVIVLWQSQPVRIAQRKLGDPALLADSEYYTIVVFGMPTAKRWKADFLKNGAMLKRANKKDMRPARALLLREDDQRATIVYMFPRSKEISKKDGIITFRMQVGPLVVSQVFSTLDMQIQERLEL